MVEGHAAQVVRHLLSARTVTVPNNHNDEEAAANGSCRHLSRLQTRQHGAVVYPVTASANHTPHSTVNKPSTLWKPLPGRNLPTICTSYCRRPSTLRDASRTAANASGSSESRVSDLDTRRARNAGVKSFSSA